MPCSYIESLCGVLEKRPVTFHLGAVREDIAVGIAAGAAMAGRLPVVYMQNSGLGYSLNAIDSLHLIYRLPALFLVTYRGPEDQGWEEHRVMGEHTEDLLRAFDLPYRVFRGEMKEEEPEEIKNTILGGELPYFLLITRGALQ